MKTLIQKVAGLAIAGSCVLGASIPAAASPASQIEWRFDSSANPGLPDVNTTPVAGAQAQVAPGPLSLGWRASLPGLDGASGFWDLGSNGTVQVALPAVNLSQVTVQVRQWNDGFIYIDCATVTVPGATLKSTSLVEETTGPIGGWVMQTTVWEATGGSSISAVNLTGAGTGSVIDQLALVTGVVVVQPLVLSIQPADSGSVELSWPEAAGSAIIESAADLNDAQGWSALAESAQLSNGRYSLVVGTGGATRYFRLKR